MHNCPAAPIEELGVNAEAMNFKCYISDGIIPHYLRTIVGVARSLRDDQRQQMQVSDLPIRKLWAASVLVLHFQFVALSRL